jgi:hypothetical protein
MKRASTPAQGSIFGGVAKPKFYGSTVPPQGYANAPGTGPEGETCGTCAHCRVRTFHRGTRKARRFYKCGLMTQAWTSSRATDVCARSPACRSHEKGEPRESGIVS